MASSKSQNMFRYAGLATQLLVMLGIAVWLGIKIDGRVKWKVPVCTILFPLGALVYSLWRLIKDLSKTKE